MAQTGKTFCIHCPVGCGLDVHVENNKPVKVEGMKESIVSPICIKARSIPEWYEYGLKDRILTPLRKKKVGWEQISWDSALDIIVDKLNQIKDKYGPEAVAHYSGQVSSNRDWFFLAKLFFQRFGSPSACSTWSMCWVTRLPAAFFTTGQYSVTTLGKAKCIVVWAGDPVNSVPLAGIAILNKKRQREAKLLVADCRRIRLAKEADVHAMLLPGTDPAFGLGLLNVIISEGLYDKEFVEKWTIGFDELAEHVKDYSPVRVEEITSVPADTIREFARVYATTKPATIFWGNALDSVDNGLQAHRCIQALMAITGNLDVSGGSRMVPLACFGKIPEDEDYPVTLETLLPEGKRWCEKRPPGADEHPFWWDFSAEAPTASVFDAIVTEKPYPVKAMIVEAANPVITWVNSNKVKRALSKLDFLVVYDFTMTETAEFADLILPACTFLEQLGIYQYVGRPMYILQNKVIEPPEGSWPDSKFWLELSKRMGYQERIPWDNAEDVLNHLLKPAGLTVDDLRREPGGIFYSKSGAEARKYEKEGFRTPSGKVELYSQRLKDLGSDPLPTYRPTGQNPEKRPDLVRSYPLCVITGTRMLEFNESMFRSLPSTRKKYPDPFAEINTGTAKELGIENGDSVIIETTNGSVQVKAKVTDDIHPSVVSVSHAWGRMANGNLLTSDDADMREPVTGAVAARGLACRVVKAAERG
ncbi:molybdopterin-dependent oxidoreductase [Chloroflexota bacterium]